MILILSSIYFFPLLKIMNCEIEISEVIDCDRKSKGCKGGSVSNAYQYIYKAGLTGRNNYTYRGYQEKCYYHPSMSVVEIQRGFLYVPPDEEKIRNFIYSYGPVTARVNIGPLQV